MIQKVIFGSVIAIALIGVGFVLVTSLKEDEPVVSSSGISSETTDETAETTVENETDTEGEENNEQFDLVSFLEEVDANNDNVSYTITDETITIESNSLPDHETGDFPNSGNPNTISEVPATYVINRSPEYQDTTTPVREFGVSLGGIKLEPGTAERDQETGWAVEALQDMLDLGLDFNNAHVQPTGSYHYHGIPTSLVADQLPTEHSALIGFAADGFPIYSQYGFADPNDTNNVKQLESSWQLKSGEREDGPAGEYDGTYTNDFEFVEGSGDLDECNGIQTVTPEYPDGTYAYFITDTFPYIGRCVHGTPDSSFQNGLGFGPPR